MRSSPLKKRLLALVAACAMAVTFVPLTMAADIPPDFGPVTFEDQQLGRAEPREFGETVQIAANPSKSGINTSDYVVQVTNRSVTPDPYAGVKFNISEFIGTRITVTAKVYMGGGQNASIKANLEQIASGASQYATIATSQNGNGTWYEVTGEFEVPPYIDQAYLYFETSATTNDFYVDDVQVVGAESQTVYADYSGYASLKDLYGDYFLIGTCTPYALLRSEDYEGLISQQYNSLTSENEAKSENLLDINACIAEPEKYNESPAVKFDTIEPTLQYCQKNGVKYRLHALVWHSQTPTALFYENYDTSGNRVSPELMSKRLENYIKQILEWCEENYPGVVYAVDVVNEAASAGQNSEWYRTFGDYSFITKAFEYADKYAPEDMKLFYNDYGMASASKQQNVINLLREAKEAGWVDGIGMQSHLSATDNMDNHVNALKIYADLGYEMQLTELDITVPWSGTEEEKFAQQATAYENLFRNLVEAKKQGYNITSVTIWGVADNFSWKNSQLPILFNADLSKKPAFDALVALGEEAKLDATVSNLQAIVNDMEAMDTTMYTSDSVAALTDAVNAAKALLAEGANPTQAQLDQAIADIEAAQAGLVPNTPEEENPGENPDPGDTPNPDETPGPDENPNPDASPDPDKAPDQVEEPSKTGDNMPLAALTVFSVCAAVAAGVVFVKKRHLR